MKKLLKAVKDFFGREPRFNRSVYNAIIIAMLLGAISLPLLLVAIPFTEFWNGMAVQRKGKSQMTHGRLFDQELLVDRQPVPGTIPRGYFPHPAELEGNSPEIIALAGKKLVNPLPRNRETIARGEHIFKNYCITCHGPKGHGDGSVVGPDRFPAPTSLQNQIVLDYPDGSIYQIISRGKGKMHGYAEKLDPEERWAVIRYVRVLQTAEHPDRKF